MPLDPGYSTLTTCTFDRNNTSLSPGVGQELLIGSGSNSCGSVPIAWTGIGGATVRVGVSGRFTVTGNACTLNIRVGHTGSFSVNTFSGTIVHSVALPLGTTIIDELSAPFAALSGNSYMQLTISSVAGGTATATGLTPVIVPDTIMQAKLCSMVPVMLHSTNVEVVRGSWLIDFDTFDTDDVAIRFTGRTFQAVGESGTYRMRIGGTRTGNDGTVVWSYIDNTGQSGDGHLTGTTATVANPGGVQYVKISVQSGAGFAVQCRGCSFLIKGV